MENTCLICHELFQTKSNYQCFNNECNVFICDPCIETWDKMYSNLECPICHTSREIQDIENQTQVILPTERIIQRNQIHPLETISMSSRGRMLFIIARNTDNPDNPDFLDEYCDYLFNSQIRCFKKFCQIVNCILLGIGITIVIGFIFVNFLYLTEYNGSLQNVINQTKDHYKEPDHYVTLSINGSCIVIAFFFLVGCCQNCYEKCK